MKRIVGAGVALALAVNFSWADTLNSVETFLLQTTLNEHGFDVGKPDGKIGPATQKALQQFSATYGGPADPSGAYDHMLNLSIKSMEIVTSETLLASIKTELMSQLLDSSAASVKDVYFVNPPSGRAICGTLSTSGGEVRFIGSDLFGEKFLLTQLDNSYHGAADMMCSMAFPKRLP